MIRAMDGTIRHRLLVNYAADPEVVVPLLPPGLRPQLVRAGRPSSASACSASRTSGPREVPSWLGATSDAAAHRIAVEWDGPSGTDVGVYVLRRDAAEGLPVLGGGRVFPGVHGRARFIAEGDADRLHVDMRTSDGVVVDVTVGPASEWSSRLFADAATASTFFEGGACGWSPDRTGCLEGIEMRTDHWTAEPVSVAARSSFYEDPDRFPPGSLHLDAALLMRDLPVTWRQIAAPECFTSPQGVLP